MKIKLVFAILLIITSAFNMNAQFFALNAKSTSKINNDSIYLFKNFDNAKIIANNELANEIQWFAFNKDTKAFDTLIHKSNAKIDTLSIDKEQGILIKFITAESIIEYHCWCFAPTIKSVELAIDTIACDYLQANAITHYDTLKIFNSEIGKYTNVPQKILYHWSYSDSLLLTTNLETVELESPMKDCEIKVQALNQVGNEAIATDSLPSYGVEAKFSFKPREHSIQNEISKDDALSAPMEIEFTNESKGDYTVSEWVMGNLSRLYDENPVYSFQKSGKYTISLIVTNENSQCSSIDSTAHVTITESAIEFPDVFTPNGDGVNDEFRPAYKSIKSYEITIYNRWGRKVYTSKDPATGWNGKINNNDAAEGVYMYTSEAEGYDKGVKFHRKGSVTLIR